MQNEDLGNLEGRIKRVETALILLSVAAIASGDHLFGPDISLGYLYLIPLSYSALAHRWPVTIALTALCVYLRQSFGPLERSSWALIARDWILTAVFLAVVVTLHRLGRARAAFFEKARRQRDELLRELVLAAAVQQHLLERHLPPAGPLDVVARTVPAREVGGDYYDFIPLERGRFAVVVVDVSGKGLPAALLMPAVKIALRTLSARHEKTADVLRELNALLLDNLAHASYITLFFAAFDPVAGRLEYANCGHQPALQLRARGGEPAWLRTGGAAVGLIPDVSFETAEVALEAGDVFVFYSDGITEAEDEAGSDFGHERLLAIAREGRGQSAAALVSSLHEAVERHRGKDVAADDATVIVVRVPDAGR